MTTYCNGFMFSSDTNEVALIVKSKPAWMAGKLNGIGGAVEAGESTVEAQVREFYEETGVKTLPHEWRRFGRISGSNGVKVAGQPWSVDLFVAYTDLVREVQTVTEEHVLLANYWRAVNGSYDPKLIPNLNWILPLARIFRSAPSYTECRYES